MVIIRKKHKESPEEKGARLEKEQAEARGIQDEYQVRGFELVSWVQDHKGVVSIVIVVLMLAGGLLSAFLYYQKRSMEAASGAYFEAMKLVESGEANIDSGREKLKKAQADLEELGKSRGGSGIGVLANLYAGHLALEDKDKKEAVALYQAALLQIGKSDLLYPLAMTGYGYAQEDSGDLKGALATFDALIEMKENPSKDLALFEAARLASKLKETESAKKNLAHLLEEYPSSVYESSAQRLKESLK
jgi:hypothetical protein